MNKRVSVFYNGAYKDKPQEYPRQIGRMTEMSKRLKKVGAEGHFIPIHFRGEGVNRVHAHLAEQVREKIRKVVDDKMVVFGGDGFSGAMINALGNVHTDLLDVDRILAEAMNDNAVMVAKGGSLNLFAKRLGSDRDGALEDFVEDVELPVVEVRRRVLEISAMDEHKPDKSVFTQSYPFAFFAGTGTDALMVKLQEAQSRAQHWALSVARITAETVKNFWVNGGGFNLNTLITFPRFGLMHLPRGMETLSEKAFIQLKSAAQNALDTSAIMLKGHLAMSNEHLAKIFLESGQRDYNISKIKGWDKAPVKSNCPQGVCFYTDGSPMIFELQQEEQAQVSAYTLDAPPIKVVSFRPENKDEDVWPQENSWRNVV